ncbi:MAG: M23 family metallopeptidase [candidate division KSB1 bacterium]|nr:M23 family metallopeptidase [candidate division KSB1 bacterium]MDZ7303386.1 M23 family metallopeptidase [candidate division KSB1 bacterium]MDZ7312296.1 M23 family metallopeptidase [candidate division KSB1 bacterium]
MEWNETEKWSAGKGKLESQVFYGQGGGAYIDDEDNIYPSLLDSRHEELTALPPHAGYGDSANVFTSTDLLTQLEVRLSRTQQLQKTIVDKFEIRRKQLEHTPSIKPLLSGRITDLFGKRKDPFIYRTRHHQGLDIGAPRGTEVFAPASGVVELVKNTYRRNRGYGKAVVINHGYGIKTLYGHLSEIKVKLGQRVERWDLIGLVGDTGRATGPHLHYEVWVDGDATDPLRFILNN